MSPASYETLTPAAATPDVVAALGRRLAAAAAHIFAADERPGIHGLHERGAGVLADALFRHLRERGSDGELWLALVALTASYPDIELVLACRRSLAVTPPELCLAAVLENVQVTFRHFDALDLDLEIVTDRPVVDVDFCAKYDHNSGIQRVVRETMSRWSADHDVVLACWTKGDNALRQLTLVEHRRVTDWNRFKLLSADERAAEEAYARSAAAESVSRPRLVVPYGTVLVLPEVAKPGTSPGLAAAARFSPNTVSMVGHDAVPVVSAQLVAENESEMFGSYLSVVKHADVVAGVSESAAGEFRGFFDAVAAQGLPSARVTAVPLAVEVPERGAAERAVVSSGEAPLVLMVGNQEARKNNLAVLFAAETLWREGIRFRLRMIGGGKSAYTRLIDRYAMRLQRQGRPFEAIRNASDALLVDSYAAARFTVFPSLHEGFGLPAAESLAMGIPTVTSNYGSTAEIAAAGGALVVDPRSDDELTDALRRLLTDDELHARLVREALARPTRGWNDYAEQLWNELVANEVEPDA